VFLILTGLFYLLMTPVSLPRMMIQETVLDRWIYLLILFFGIVVLVYRSGLSLKPKRPRRFPDNA